MALAGQSVPAAPKVSVVMPTRNRAFCLGEAIDSILAQTFQDWELIVVDDGSEDGTRDLVHHYCARDSRIRYVRQPHGGQARSQNTALRLVRGDYLFKMDDDDVAHADLLEICAAGLDAHPDHWAASFKRRFYSDYHKSGWIFDSCQMAGPLFYRVSALRALKGWNELYIFLEDTDLNFRGSFYRCWPVWRCEMPLYDYRISWTSNASARVNKLEALCIGYMRDRNWDLVRWGIFFDPPPRQTPRQAAAAFSAAHRRNGLLPRARFAHWHRPALEDVRKSRPEDFCSNVLESVKVRPRFPWVPLWKAEWALWQRLRFLRLPLSRCAEAMWDLACNHYFRLQGTQGTQGKK